MSRPTLLVVAGCNGSGKSTFSKFLAPAEFVPFDYDSFFLKFYKTLFDSDIRDVMAHNMAREELEAQIHSAISKKENFCYETNFNSTPLYWPEHFKHNGYQIDMIFLCLDSIEEAKRRVTIRIQNGGHYVPEDEITKRYYQGFSNINDHFMFFSSIHFFDSSAYLERPKHLISIQDGQIRQVTQFPEYLKKLIPAISAAANT